MVRVSGVARDSAIASAVVLGIGCTPAPSEAHGPQSHCSSKRETLTSVGAGDRLPSVVSIAEVQGTAHRSPLVDRQVQVTGVVTALRADGFYLQSQLPDANPATSEGLFVATGETPAVLSGDVVTLTGRVMETRPGCSDCGPDDAAFDHLTETEIASPSGLRLGPSGGHRPEPVVIGMKGRPPPASSIDSDTGGDVEDASQGDFDPCGDAIDFYESLEHMLVRVDEARAVGPTTDSGEIAVVGDGGRYASGWTARGGVLVRPDDSNPERILLDDAIVPDAPSVHVGARFLEPVVGVLGYARASFRLFNTVPLSVEGATDLRREEHGLGERAADELDLATLNVRNLSVTEPEERFVGLAEVVTHSLKSPDVLVLQEVQDDSGAADDGVVTSNETLASLVRAIEAVGGPCYQFFDIAPEDGADGGQPGGNIRVAFLVSAERGAQLVMRDGASPSTANEVVVDEEKVRLRFSPGRIDPTNAAFTKSRKPLAAEISFRGTSLVVIGNHFSSKSADEPLYGRWQPPTLVSEAKRQAQAQVVADFVSNLLAADPGLAVLVAGDFNDFEFSTPLATLEGAPLANALSSLPVLDRYTYVFEGNSQALDHVLLTERLRQRGFEYDIVHVNAEFYDGLSDHDPSVLRVRLE